MSFGPSNTTKSTENNLAGTASTAANQQYPLITAAGANLFNQGQGPIQSGVNWMNTILGGNTANTAAALQPSINQIQGNTSNALTAANTLTPRGGGRSGTLYNTSFAPQAQIQNLFNQARTGAAQALPNIGTTLTGQGANLFGLGNQALSAATGANAPLLQGSLQQEQINNQLISGLGAGLLGLATTPFGGGGAVNGLLGLIGGSPSGGGGGGGGNYTGNYGGYFGG
jgi:hypothetical protein